MFYKALRACTIDSTDGKQTGIRLADGEVIEAPAGAFKHVGGDVLQASKKDPRKKDPSADPEAE